MRGGQSENGAKSTSLAATNGSAASKKSTNRLMTRFRVPLSGKLRGQVRGPTSKEDREVMDTGRIKRWREKREQVCYSEHQL